MTFSARESEERPGAVQIDYHYGPAHFKMTEDSLSHLRKFWGDLGHLLNKIDHGFTEDDEPVAE